MNAAHPAAPRAHNLSARRPLLVYFVLSYALFWSFLALAFVGTSVLGLTPDTVPAWIMALFAIMGSWMPNLAAAIVAGNSEGRAGVKRLFRKYLRFRFGFAWYSAAILPMLLAFAAAGLYRLWGSPASGGAGLSPVFWAGLIGLNLLQGATGEEAGWRGFALPRLVARHGPVKAALILGLLWDFWHLPLWLMSGYTGSLLLYYISAFSVGIISLTFLMTWIAGQVPDSLVPMVIAHFCLNAGLNLVDARGLGLGPDLPLLAIMAGLLLVAVIVVASLGGLTERNMRRDSVCPVAG